MRCIGRGYCFFRVVVYDNGLIHTSCVIEGIYVLGFQVARLPFDSAQRRKGVMQAACQTQVDARFTITTQVYLGWPRIGADRISGANQGLYDSEGGYSYA